MLFNLLFGGGGGVKYDSILFGTILVLLLVVFIGLLSLKSEDTNDARIKVRWALSARCICFRFVHPFESRHNYTSPLSVHM